jgi:ATP-dependent RNA helicase DeaD
MADLLPETIAAALVRAMRAELPAPEDLVAQESRGDPRGGDPREAGPRQGFEGASWFRINAGRRHNADPRWLLPVICRYGHVSRNEIGAIRIAAADSYFQVSERAVPGFIKALRRAKIAPEDEGMIIELAQPRDVGAASGPPPARPSNQPSMKPRAKPGYKGKRKG